MASIVSVSPRDLPNRTAIYVRNAHEIPNITKHVVFFNGDGQLTAEVCLGILSAKTYEYPGENAPGAILGIKDVPGSRAVTVDLASVKTAVWAGTSVDVFLELAKRGAGELRMFKHLVWNHIVTSEFDPQLGDLQIRRHSDVLEAIRSVGQNVETSLITSLPSIYVVDDNSDTPTRCVFDDKILVAVLPDVKYIEFSFIDLEQKRRKTNEIKREHEAEYAFTIPTLHTREKIGILEAVLFPLIPDRVVLSTNTSFDLVDETRKRIFMLVESMVHCILLANEGKYAIDINGHFQAVQQTAPAPAPTTQ